MPALADLDGDGAVEIIKVVFNLPLNSPPIVADLDGDGQQDIITSSRAFRADGTKFIDTMLAQSEYGPGTQDWKGPWPSSVTRTRRAAAPSSCRDAPAA